uniref:Uncharacterized protein n=1 Tax=Cacopsylla melanoneura TaxID=428564 RepID=A0A8D9BNA1_9HEMI
MLIVQIQLMGIIRICPSLTCVNLKTVLTICTLYNLREVEVQCMVAKVPIFLLCPRKIARNIKNEPPAGKKFRLFEKNQIQDLIMKKKKTIGTVSIKYYFNYLKAQKNEKAILWYVTNFCLSFL